MIKLTRLLILIIHLIVLINIILTYKLNVPKVLLPFHSSNLINFTLELINEDDDIVHQQTQQLNERRQSCFVWSSSRPDIVSIEPIYDDTSNKCATKAIVSAISKYSQRQTSIIFAKETINDKLIRCDVIIDKINEIRIKHTTTQLYLEDSPECFVCEAFDLEGNTFTSIEGLPFEWLIIEDNLNKQQQNNANYLDTRNVLKMLNFIESEYTVSDTIRNLEMQGYNGNKILIEGVKTGTANVKAKLLDAYYKDMNTQLVRLLVVANIFLEPSYPVYLLNGTFIKYKIILIKQTSSEEIELPSIQYYFESKNQTCAYVKPADSSYVFAGNSICKTDIVLIDRNMKEFAEQYIPPTSEINVVKANYLEFYLKNFQILTTPPDKLIEKTLITSATSSSKTTTPSSSSPWIIEVDKLYEIEVNIFTEDDKKIYSSDNIKLTTIFDLDYFDIIEQTKNGSYVYVYAKKSGLTHAKSTLNGVIDTDGNLIRLHSRDNEVEINARQEIEILSPISVIPPVLVFAWRFNLTSINVQQQQQQLQLMGSCEYQLNAVGGSGNYYWQSKNTTIILVNANGYLKLNQRNLNQLNQQPTKSFETQVYAYDQKNFNINSFSRILLLEPTQLDIQKCPIEANVNKNLYLRIKMSAIYNDKKVLINDCSKLNFKIWLQNENIFKFIKIENKKDIDVVDSVRYDGAYNNEDDESCAIINLKAINEGLTLIRVSYELDDNKNYLESEQFIYSYSNLYTKKSFYLLNHLSSYLINVHGGPYLIQQQESSNLEQQKLNEVLNVDNENLIEILKKYDSVSKHNNYKVSCKELNGETNVRLVISNELNVNLNRCPLKFEHIFKIKCSKPYKLELNHLLLNRSKLAYLPECPFKPVQTQITSNSETSNPTLTQHAQNILIQHSKMPLNIEIKVKDELNNEFDNFTSIKDKIDWLIDDKKLLDIYRSQAKEHTNTPLKPSTDYHGISQVEIDNNKIIYYKTFSTKNQVGNVNLEAKLNKLSSKLFIKLIDNLKVITTASNALEINQQRGTSGEVNSNNLITIINHPINIVNLQIVNGSGYYYASLTSSMLVTQAETSNKNVIDFELNENNLIIKPITVGKALLTIYDYCILQSEINDAIATTSSNGVFISNEYKLQLDITDINTIHVEIIDNKLEFNKYLILYVQINDANGNRLKKSLFNLMNLKSKLTLTSSSTVVNKNINYILKEITPDLINKNDEFYLNLIKTTKNEQINYEKIIKLNFNDDYTALYVLHASKYDLQPSSTPTRIATVDGTNNGYDNIVHIKFEANLNNGPLIKSKQYDVYLYDKLNVQPKQLDLIIGSIYQLKFFGGPQLDDNTYIQYEYLDGDKENLISTQKTINIHQNGTINALNNGNLRVRVKIVSSCSTQEASLISLHKLCELIKLSSSKQITAHHQHEVIYTHDTIDVKVIQLKSIHIETPLKSIKCGNYMPVSLIANKINDINYLKAYTFATSDYLDYKWSISNSNIAKLESNLIDSAQINFKLNQFSIVFRTKHCLTGTVRINVQISVKNSTKTKSLHLINAKNDILNDHLDIQIIDEFKLSFLNNFKQHLLLAPGNSIKFQTNKHGSKRVVYELHETAVSIDESNQNKFVKCSLNNNTNQIQLDRNDGTLTIDKSFNLNQYKYQTCLLTLVARLNENEFNKEQLLYYLVKIKPIKYYLIKSNTNLTLKSEQHGSIIFDYLPLNIDFNLEIAYYDDLGDQFYSQAIKNNEKKTTTLDYDLNRNDLIQINEFDNYSIKIRAIKSGSLLLTLRQSLSSLNSGEQQFDYNVKINMNQLTFRPILDEQLATINDEIQINQMDIIYFNKNYNKLNDLYYWSFNEQDTINHQLVFLNTQQTLAVALCLNTGSPIELELKLREAEISNVENRFNFGRIKFNCQQVNRINLIENFDNKYYVLSDSDTDTSVDFQFRFNRDGHKNVKYLDLAYNDNITIENLENEINENLDYIRILPFKCLFNLKFDTSSTKNNDLAAYLAKYFVYKPIYKQNKWSCELSTSRKFKLLNFYEYIVELNRKIIQEVASQDNQNQYNIADDSVDDDRVKFLNLPSHLELYSSIDPHNVNSDKFLINLYTKFVVNSNEIEFNIKNLYLNPDDINKATSSSSSNIKSLNKLRVEQNFHVKFYIYTFQNLVKTIQVKASSENLFKIKQVNYVRKTQRLYYDIELLEFNLENIVNIIQTNEIYIEIASEITQQSIKVPVKFRFDNSFNLIQDKNGFLHITTNIQQTIQKLNIKQQAALNANRDTILNIEQKQQQQQQHGAFNRLVNSLNSNQLIYYLAIISLILFLLLFLLKLKIPSNDQMPQMGAFRQQQAQIIQPQQQKPQQAQSFFNRFITSSPMPPPQPQPLNQSTSLRYRGGPNYSSSFSTSQSFLSPNNTDRVRLYSIDTDAPAYNDNSRFYNSRFDQDYNQ